MRRVTTLLCAGALLMTGVACSDDDDDASSSEETSSTTTTSTPEPDGPKDIAGFGFDAQLEPGTYFMDPDLDPSTPLRVTFEIAAEGWSGGVGGPAKFNPAGHTGLAFINVDNLVTDACEDPAPQDPPVGPTVDDLATALSELSPFEATEPPTDVSLLGYQGKHLKISVPDLEVRGSGDTAEYADCVNGNMHSWIEPGADEPFFGYNAEPGRYDEYWILDVDGTRVMIAMNSSPAMPAQELAEAEAIIDSIQFES